MVVLAEVDICSPGCACAGGRCNSVASPMIPITVLNKVQRFIPLKRESAEICLRFGIREEAAVKPICLQ